MHTASCKVYVTIAYGVYRIQNNYSKLYMSTSDRASSLANVYQETADSGNETGLRQMWRIKYLSDGYYSIRPMHNLSTALSVYNNDAYVNTASTADSLGALTLNSRWKIGEMVGFTYFYPASIAAAALMLNSNTSASGANITVSANDHSAARQQWLLLPVSPAPSGVRWCDNTGNPITGTPERYLTPGETKTLSALKLMAVSYNISNISQTFEWSSSNTNVATVNASTGQVITVAPGTVTIRGRKVLNGQEKLLTFTLKVTEIPNGTYLIKSKLTGKMADIENQTMADNTLIHQWEYHTGSTQRWIFTHIGDGYYTIKSEYSGSTAYYLGVQNDSTAQDASIVLRSGTITDGMKWKISKTVYGAYKLMPKTGEANNRVLAIENNLLYENNGVKIRQRNYVQDDNFKDEWYLITYDYIVNLDVLYDHAYLNRYPNAVDKINNALTKLQQKYLEEFRVLVNFSSPTKFTSYGDSCSTNPSTKCIHGNGNCEDSVAYLDGSKDLKEYHHKNIINIQLRIPFPDLSQTTRLAFIGHDTCNASSHAESPYYGLTYSGLGLITITNFNGEIDEIRTVVHEFGHLYNAPDHYRNGQPSTWDMNNTPGTGCGQFNANCIYGENRSYPEISNNLIICEGCKARIREKLDRFNHS